MVYEREYRLLLRTVAGIPPANSDIATGRQKMSVSLDPDALVARGLYHVINHIGGVAEPVQ
jgi:hypothetical protein